MIANPIDKSRQKELRGYFRVTKRKEKCMRTTVTRERNIELFIRMNEVRNGKNIPIFFYF
jgi:hypothetical protein